MILERYSFDLKLTWKWQVGDLLSFLFLDFKTQRAFYQTQFYVDSVLSKILPFDFRFSLKYAAILICVFVHYIFISYDFVYLINPILFLHP